MAGLKAHLTCPIETSMTLWYAMYHLLLMACKQNFDALYRYLQLHNGFGHCLLFIYYFLCLTASHGSIFQRGSDLQSDHSAFPEGRAGHGGESKWQCAADIYSIIYIYILIAVFAVFSYLFLLLILFINYLFIFLIVKVSFIPQVLFISVNFGHCSL